MTTIIYVPRAFGGCLILTITLAPPPPINITPVARKGTITLVAREA